MCVKCASWKMNDTCVDDCPTIGYFKDEDTRECKPCFETCETCKGPKKSDCTTCKNFELWQNERLTCLDQCSKRHYEQEGKCYPCDDSCYELG